MNPHYPAGLMPMMMHQQIGGQQYMMAVRLPSAGIPPPSPHAQQYLAGAGVQGVQGLQGLPVTIGQPQMIPAGHLAASPSPQAALAVHSAAPTTSTPTASAVTMTPPTLMTVPTSLSTSMSQMGAATAGIPASMLAASPYAMSGLPGLSAVSLAGAGIPGMGGMAGVGGLVSAPSHMTAGQVGMAAAQYPGLSGAQVATLSGAQAAQMAGLPPSAYSQQVANLANAQLAGLQAQQMAAGIPSSHMAQYGSQLQASGLAGLQMAVPQIGQTQASPPPASTTPDSKKKVQQDAAAQAAAAAAAAAQGLQVQNFGGGYLDPQQQQQQQLQVASQEQDTSLDDSIVMLDDYNSDLNLSIDENGYGAQPLVDPPGFCFCWAGARCSHGICRGKAYYECKVIEHLKVDFGEDHQETNPHIVRVGWSMDSTSFQLGEEPNSYGYGGTAKFSTNNKFTNYGEKLVVGDVVGCLLDLDSRPPNISYAKNGRWLGVAQPLHGFQVGKKESALFPHILSKNVRFEVNFGQQAPWFPPAPGFMYIMQYPVQERVRGLKPPSSKSSCEMIMIIGLPGAGKTTWGINKAKDNPEMRYNIIGTDTLIDKMKVMGLPRKNNYHGRWDVLIDKASKCLNKLFEIASKKKRNYILDQTNVYPSARRRKMKNFKGFIRRAAVMVPDDNELKRRSDKRTYEDGKYVPEEAVLDMKANFKLPLENDDNFDYIEYVEMPREKAVPLVESYNMEGQSKRPQSVKGGGNRNYQADNRFKPPADLKQDDDLDSISDTDVSVSTEDFYIIKRDVHPSRSSYTRMKEAHNSHRQSPDYNRGHENICSNFNKLNINRPNSAGTRMNFNTNPRGASFGVGNRQPFNVNQGNMNGHRGFYRQGEQTRPPYSQGRGVEDLYRPRMMNFNRPPEHFGSFQYVGMRGPPNFPGNNVTTNFSGNHQRPAGMFVNRPRSNYNGPRQPWRGYRY